MATISYGTFTIVNELDGSQFWSTTVEPVSPDYTFSISDLVGDTNADIKIGDVILYSHYRYTVLNINQDGTTVRGGNRESLKGVDGISPTVKSIVCSHAAVICEKDGTYNPDTIKFSGQAIFENNINDYQGWFVIELSSDSETWVSNYTSASKESFVNYKIPLGLNITKNGILYYQGSDITTNGSIVDTNFTISSEGVISTTQDIGFIIRSIRCSLYSDANKTDLVDQQRINIAFDGVDGDKGDDGYTVILTNENHTFAGNTTSAVNGSTECEVIAYKGEQKIITHIGTIDGCPQGMTVSIPINDATNSKFIVNVTTQMITQNGVLNVPVTIDDKTFNMKFTYSLKLNGLDSTGLGWMVNYSTPTTPNDGECIYFGFDEATKEPSFEKDGWVLWNGHEITIPHGCYINPDETMPYNTTIYSVYRLPDVTTYTGGTFHDVAWIESSNTWKSNTYNGVTATADSVEWVWHEDTDIILAMYVEPSNEGTITNAQLFTPPKKFSELTEPAKGMAKEAEKVATNYLAVDNTGIMVADMQNGEQTPSGILTGKNVFIDSNSVNIRNGQSLLSSFSDSQIILGEANKSRLKLSSSAICGVTNTDVKNFEIINGDSGDAVTYNETGSFNNTSEESNKFDGIFIVNHNIDLRDVISITVSATWGYSVDGVHETSTIRGTISKEDYKDGEVPSTTWFMQTTSTRFFFTESLSLLYNTNGFRLSTTIRPKGTTQSIIIDNTATYSFSIITDKYQDASFTFGSRIDSNIGANSCVIGEQLMASSRNQVAIGRCNKDDLDKQYLFMVGNGISGIDRNNAFSVDWSGVAEAANLKLTESMIHSNSEENFIKCTNINEDDVFTVTKTGDVTIANDLNIGGDININDLSIDGDISATGDIDSVTNINATGNSTIGGTSTITGKLTANGGVDVVGDIGVTGDIDVTNGGISTTGDLDVGGDTTITGNATITGNTGMTGNLNVNGTITGNSLPLLKTEAFYWNTTINANSAFTSYGFDVTQSGYTALGVVTFGVYDQSTGGRNSGWCVVPKCILWGGDTQTLDLYVWNQHPSQSAVVTVIVKVLYALPSII